MYERDETHSFTVTYGLRRTEEGDAEILIMSVSGDGGAFHHPDDFLLEAYDSIEEAYESEPGMFVYDLVPASLIPDNASDDDILRAYFDPSYGVVD